MSDPTIADLCTYLHDHFPIYLRTEHQIDFGEAKKIKRTSLIKELTPTLVKIFTKEAWPDLLMSIATHDKGWATSFTEALFDSSSYRENTNAALAVRLWIDKDNTSSQEDKRYLFEDVKSGRLSGISYPVWMASTSKNDREAVKYDVQLARKVYDKSRMDGAWDDEVEDSPGGTVYPVRYFNLHSPPASARMSTDGMDLTKPPAEIQEFMELLVKPDPKQIDWTYSWLHYAVTSRAPTIPILSGNKGIGKTIWTDLIRCLFAVSRAAPRDFFETPFNAPFLRGNEYCPIDEFPGELLAIRKYMSKYQMVQSKGIDSFMTEIHTNFTITTNPENKLELAPNERIFSVLDVTEDNLLVHWSPERITQFVEDLDPSRITPLQTHWYHFIKNYTPKYPKAHVWKGERFLSLVTEGLPDWQAFLREQCLKELEKYEGDDERGEILITKLRKEYSAIRKSMGSGGSAFPKNKVAKFLLDMAGIGEVLGTLVDKPQRIIVGQDPRADDIGEL